VVARDGIEPPTPAFSGLPDNVAKWPGISGYSSKQMTYEGAVLVPSGMI
jgi:hypothetical protein